MLSLPSKWFENIHMGMLKRVVINCKDFFSQSVRLNHRPTFFGLDFYIFCVGFWVDLVRPVHYVSVLDLWKIWSKSLTANGKKVGAQSLKKTSVLNILLPRKSMDDFFFSSYIKFQFHQFQRLGFVLKIEFLGIGFRGNFNKYVWLLFNFPWNYMYTVSYHGKD